MRLLLIQPFAAESNTNYPPLGLLHLAGYVLARSKWEVRVLDLRLHREPLQDRLEEIRGFDPDVVGLTGMSIEQSAIRQMAFQLKSGLKPKTLLILGGPHATIFKSLLLQEAPFDHLVKGEGEQTLLELLQAVESGSAPKDIPGLVSRDAQGRAVEAADREPIPDLDSLPFPAWHLLDVEGYFKNPHFHGNLNVSRRVLPLLTSRGCPFHCGFCHHAFGFAFRPRSAENVVKEIKWMRDVFGLKEIQIEDDTFNLKPERAKQIMREVLRQGLKLHFAFPSGLRADLLDEELAGLLKSAGTYRVHFGIETASPRVQKLAGKPLDLGGMGQAISLADGKGISTHGFFILGFPTETREEMEETIRWAGRSNLATANFSLLKLFPGTPLYREHVREAPRYSDDFSFSYDSTAANLSNVPDDELKGLQKSALLRFFLKPSRLWRIFRTTPGKTGLFTKNLSTFLSLALAGRARY
jgi:anaerobic magnesium-protoporphyrin IX monomethyl ester cyclase